MIVTEQVGDISQVVENAEGEAEEYKKALRRVERSAAQVATYRFGNLKKPQSAPWYQKAKRQWANTSGELTGWADSTLRSVIAVPKALIEGSNNHIVPTLNSAIKEADYLIEHPGSKQFKGLLHEDLSALEIRLQRDIRTVKSIVSYMKGGKETFQKNADLMQEIAKKAKNTAKADKERVEKLNDRIDQLHNDIRSKAVAAAGGSLATIAGVIMGGIGIVLAPATGGVSLTLLVPAAVITGGGVVGVALSAAQIVEDKKKISLLSEDIDQYNADITTLQNMNSHLNRLSKRVEGVKGSIDKIVKPWDAMQKYFSNVREGLNDLSSSQDWSKVKSSLQKVKHTWQTHVSTLKKLKQAGTKVSTSDKLEVGMDARQVRKAVPPNTRKNLVPYIEQSAGTH